MLDSRIIDLSFNKIFLKLILGEEVALTIDNLRVSIALCLVQCEALTLFQRVDAELAASLVKLRNMTATNGQSDKVRTKTLNASGNI